MYNNYTSLNIPGLQDQLATSTHVEDLKAPSHSLLCEWVKSTWELVSIEMVKDSFLSCAITTAIDGSDNSNIHCFTPG